MKTFVAIYVGTPEAMERSGWLAMSDSRKEERQRAGIEAWGRWVEANQEAIVDVGAPLGKTKKVSAAGLSDSNNNMAAYTIVRAPTHEAAARLFEGHPHFTIFPGDSVEIMECMPRPGA